MSTTLTLPACDGCGDPAAYRDRPNEAGTIDALCDDCARYRGAERRGEAYAALEVLGFAVSLARGARLSDEQIREALESTLTDPHSDGSYPVGGDQVLGSDFKASRPWATGMDPIDPERS